MQIVRPLTQDENEYLSELHQKVQEHANKAQEYGNLLQRAANMLTEEGQQVDLGNGVIVTHDIEEDELPEDEE